MKIILNEKQLIVKQSIVTVIYIRNVDVTDPFQIGRLLQDWMSKKIPSTNWESMYIALRKFIRLNGIGFFTLCHQGIDLNMLVSWMDAQGYMTKKDEA